MFQVVYRGNVCTVAETRATGGVEMAFFLYDKVTRKWIWVNADETAAY